MKKKVEVCYDDGTPVVLNAREENMIRVLNKMIVNNNVGYEVDITTLTSISKVISEQKFFTCAPADYLPVIVGEHGFATQILNYRSFDVNEDFEAGYLNNGGGNARLSLAETGVDAVPTLVLAWAKAMQYTMMEIGEATQSGNWNLIRSRERSRKRNWDLGIQRIAFLGSKTNKNVHGLLTLPDITVDRQLIKKPLKSMSESELKTFLANVVEAYRENANRSAFPTGLFVPESDYNGLVSPSSPTYQSQSVKKMIEDALKEATMNPNFKVLPLAYADVKHSDGALQHNRYVLSNYDEESLKLDIPLDYTNTQQNTVNGFTFESVAYGRHSGVVALRPKELLYMDLAAPQAPAS